MVLLVQPVSRWPGDYGLLVNVYVWAPGTDKGALKTQGQAGHSRCVGSKHTCFSSTFPVSHHYSVCYTEPRAFLPEADGSHV